MHIAICVNMVLLIKWASVNRYIAKSYDRINLTVSKGKKERIQNYAQSVGESVNGFINRAIDEALKEEDSDLK